jgi:hypothetical protein
MKKEDKDLLVRDLCARLPYGVKILHEGWNYEWDDELSTVERVVGIDDKFVYTKVIDTHNGEEYRDDKHTISLFDDKIFLRPMSSMTEKEKKELKDLLDAELVSCSDFGYLEGGTLVEYISSIPYSLCIYVIDWLNAHHFDYRGLIEKGLALPAPEGMYN